MKKCFLNWNKDTVEDDVIFEHLFELSNGVIDLRSGDLVLSESSSLLKTRKQRQGQSSGKKKSTSKNYRKRY